MPVLRPLLLLAIIVSASPASLTLHAQSVRPRPRLDSTALRPWLGVRLRTVQVSALTRIVENSVSVSCDLDLARDGSRPPIVAGLRGDIEKVNDGNINAMSSQDVYADVFARISLGDDWLRVDLLGGYSHLWHQHSRQDLGTYGSVSDALRFGGEVRWLFLDPVGIVARVLISTPITIDNSAGGLRSGRLAGGIGLMASFTP